MNIEAYKNNIALCGESLEYFHRYKTLEFLKILKNKGFSPDSA